MAALMMDERDRLIQQDKQFITAEAKRVDPTQPRSLHRDDHDYQN
jgi:hypothetical protein